MGPGALHQFTTGSQTRRRLRRNAKVLRMIQEPGNSAGLTAQDLADRFKCPLRTMQRSLTALVESGELQRSSRRHAKGEDVVYRAVIA